LFKAVFKLFGTQMNVFTKNCDFQILKYIRETVIFQILKYI